MLVMLIKWITFKGAEVEKIVQSKKQKVKLGNLFT